MLETEVRNQRGVGAESLGGQLKTGARARRRLVKEQRDAALGQDAVADRADLGSQAQLHGRADGSHRRRSGPAPIATNLDCEGTAMLEVEACEAADERCGGGSYSAFAGFASALCFLPFASGGKRKLTAENCPI